MHYKGGPSNYLFQLFLTLQGRPEENSSYFSNVQPCTITCTLDAFIKVVIITNLEPKKKNLHKMLKIQQIFPKLYRCRLFVVFHNLEPQNAGLVDVKKDLNAKRSKGIFVRENRKNKHSY